MSCEYYVQLAAMRGHEDYIVERMVRDDFYTLLMKNVEGNKVIRQKNLKKEGNRTPTFIFNTEVEQKNFLKYLQTDFVRFCLSIYKNGCDLGLGELELIPYLDFTQEWDDEKLFKYFGIKEEEVVFILNYIPDFYKKRSVSLANNRSVK